MLEFGLFMAITAAISAIGFFAGYRMFRHKRDNLLYTLVPLGTIAILTFVGLWSIHGLTFAKVLVALVVCGSCYLWGDSNFFKKELKEQNSANLSSNEETMQNLAVQSARRKRLREASVSDRVVEVIKTWFGADTEPITPYTELSPIYDRGLLGDVTGPIELAIGLEDKFPVGKIPDNDAESWQTVSDVIKYIETRIQQAVPASF